MTSRFPYRTSFWADPDVQAENPLGARKESADVVVVGGGYAGMSSAYYLKKAKPELKVVVLEKEHVGFGPSGRNFGAVVPGLRELRTVFLTNLDVEEERFAQSFYLDARKELERRIAEGGIACEYRHEPLLMQALDDETWAAQQREAELLRERGTPHRLLDAEDVRQAMSLPFDVKGAIVRTEWHAAQPFKLARGFGEQLRSMGVTVCEGTAVTEIDDHGSGVTVHTAEGGEVSARKAVLATNAYTQLLPQFAGMIFPRHTYVIATEALDDDAFRSLGYDEYKFVEDAGLTFYYTRVYKNRLLFGGGAVTTGLFTPSTLDRAADDAQVEYARIYDEMVSRFPQLNGVQVEAAWGGPVDSTPNFMPIIKEAPEMPNVVSCVGYNGDGLLNASISGKFVLGPVLGPEYTDPAAERIRQYMLRA
jgi:glycine/D-amino acid oxidase-like deaminating enzyme